MGAFLVEGVWVDDDDNGSERLSDRLNQLGSQGWALGGILQGVGVVRDDGEHVLRAMLIMTKRDPESSSGA